MIIIMHTYIATIKTITAQAMYCTYVYSNGTPVIIPINSDITIRLCQLQFSTHYTNKQVETKIVITIIIITLHNFPS